MSSSTLNSMKERFEQLENLRLVEIINIDYKDYTKEALELVKEELRDRGVEDFISSNNFIVIEEYNNEFVRFRDLYLRVKFDNVFKHMRKLYRVDKSTYDDYKDSFNQLLYITRTDESGIYISIQEIENEFDSSINELKVLGEDLISKEKFEIDYLEWQDWMTSLAAHSNITSVGEDAFIAHCLYLITKYGFNKDRVESVYNSSDSEEDFSHVINHKECIGDRTNVDVHPWKRYFARSIDYEIIGLLFYFICKSYNPNIGTKLLYKGFFLAPFIWLFIESLLLAKFGTTIGKRIFKIKVCKDNGELLSFKEALVRSIYVWFMGVGLGIVFVEIIFKIIAYRQLMSRGETIWDKKVQSKIKYKDMTSTDTVVAIIIIVCMVLITFFMSRR